MLLSFHHKFIFVANVKSASTSIEGTLAYLCDVRVRKSEFGKHIGLTTISEDYPWVRRYVPFNEFFVFGVIRDPVEHLLSLYNSHVHDKWVGTRLSTKGLAFDAFLNDWRKGNWQADPQHRRFHDKHGRFQMSHVIDYDKLAAEFKAVCAHLGIGEPRLKQLNVSEGSLTRNDLTAAQIARIEREYAEDYEFLRHCPRAL